MFLKKSFADSYPQRLWLLLSCINFALIPVPKDYAFSCVWRNADSYLARLCLLLCSWRNLLLIYFLEGMCMHASWFHNMSQKNMLALEYLQKSYCDCLSTKPPLAHLSPFIFLHVMRCTWWLCMHTHSIFIQFCDRIQRSSLAHTCFDFMTYSWGLYSPTFILFLWCSCVKCPSGLVLRLKSVSHNTFIFQESSQSFLSVLQAEDGLWWWWLLGALGRTWIKGNC